MNDSLRQIRPLSSDDLDAYVAISANAYPGMGIRTSADRDRLRRRLEMSMSHADEHFYGLFHGWQLWGVMKLYDFVMRLRAVDVPVGGVGSVAVDLRHKKEKVARDMLHFYLRHYRQQGTPLAALYPFRPDFYKRMGFGYGAKLNRYRVKPLDLPASGDKTAVTFIQNDEYELVRACYERVRQQTNGLFAMTRGQIKRLLERPGQQLVGVVREQTLRGYAVMRFRNYEDGNFLHNDIEVQWLVVEDTAVLYDLLAFFHSQADQVDRIVIHSHDPELHYLFRDPRNGHSGLIPPVYHKSNVQGVGIMYRVIDVPALFAALADADFNGQTIALRLRLTDSFLLENEGEWVVVWCNGRCRLDAQARPDATLSLDISDFSSLVTGAVDFATLYRLGLATLSTPETAATVQRLFTTERPLCMTDF